eukprot:11223181-Lingulodinium_polyedra.AAC.1
MPWRPLPCQRPQHRARPTQAPLRLGQDCLQRRDQPRCLRARGLVPRDEMHDRVVELNRRAHSRTAPAEEAQETDEAGAVGGH